jgi:16S rRNA (guanine1207-N2)-methyltransferase
MQTAHERLRLGGTLMVATDNPRDNWLHDQMRRLFQRVERRQSHDAAAYVARKEVLLKKRKNFECELVFRDRDRLIKAYSRPGVFAHRRVDPGARHLMAVMEIAPGERVLEIGCGSGAASLAAALRTAEVRVHAVDSSARAICCVRHGASLNGLTNVTAELNATGEFQGAGSYQLALANPPYYASFRIARHFVTAAHDALEAGGRLLLVTKQPDWYAEHLPEWYDRLEIFEMKGYYVVSGRRS